MYEIQILGRGGQGAVQGGVILVDALFKDGKHVQKIPAYAGSRRLGSVSVSVKVDNKPIRSSSYVYNPDCVVVLSSGMPTSEISEGLKEGGIAILNETRSPDELDLGVDLSKMATVDATGISSQVFGATAIPITNTVMLGAFSKTTAMVKLNTLIESIKEAFPRFAESNTELAKLGYERVKVKDYQR